MVSQLSKLNTLCHKNLKTYRNNFQTLEIFMQLSILLQQPESKNMSCTILPTQLTISSAAGEVNLFMSVTLKDGITLKDKAPLK
jgi:hypothetical protein